jgi:hypothetical protein
VAREHDAPPKGSPENRSSTISLLLRVFAQALTKSRKDRPQNLLKLPGAPFVELNRLADFSLPLSIS